jgi:opacity protein-like surface antigen
MRNLLVSGALAAMCCAFAAPVGAQTQTTTVSAQSAPREKRWSVDFGIGWDNTISGNVNSGAVGVLNNQTVVILKNSYEDVYGTGLHMRFGGGYMLDDVSELKLTFTFQSLDADLTHMGDIGVSNLYGQYSDYQSLSMDVGYRRYIPLQSRPSIRGYGEALAGIAFVDKTDVILVAPSSNFVRDATDFYDQTAAFALGVNAGVLFDVNPTLSIFSQIGFRYVTGQGDVDHLVGTDLAAINDKSSRWAMPFTAGVRFRF